MKRVAIIMLLALIVLVSGCVTTPQQTTTSSEHRITIETSTTPTSTSMTTSTTTTSTMTQTSSTTRTRSSTPPHTTSSTTTSTTMTTTHSMTTTSSTTTSRSMTTTTSNTTTTISEMMTSYITTINIHAITQIVAHYMTDVPTITISGHVYFSAGAVLFNTDYSPTIIPKYTISNTVFIIPVTSPRITLPHTLYMLYTSSTETDSVIVTYNGVTNFSYTAANSLIGTLELVYTRNTLVITFLGMTITHEMSTPPLLALPPLYWSPLGAVNGTTIMMAYSSTEPVIGWVIGSNMYDVLIDTDYNTPYIETFRVVDTLTLTTNSTTEEYSGTLTTNSVILSEVDAEGFNVVSNNGTVTVIAGTNYSAVDYDIFMLYKVMNADYTSYVVSVIGTSSLPALTDLMDWFSFRYNVVTEYSYDWYKADYDLYTTLLPDELVSNGGGICGDFALFWMVYGWGLGLTPTEVILDFESDTIGHAFVIMSNIVFENNIVGEDPDYVFGYWYSLSGPYTAYFIVMPYGGTPYIYSKVITTYSSIPFVRKTTFDVTESIIVRTVTYTASYNYSLPWYTYVWTGVTYTTSIGLYDVLSPAPEVIAATPLYHVGNTWYGPNVYAAGYFTAVVNYNTVTIYRFVADYSITYTAIDVFI